MGTDYSYVREAVAFFGSELPCTLLISGDGSEVWLNSLFTKDLEKLPTLKGMIGLFLSEDGNAIAIANIFRNEDDGFYLLAKELSCLPC